MQNDELSGLWEAFIFYIENSEDKPGLINWIKDCVPLQITANIFEIGVKRPFVKDFLESRYLDVLEKAILEITGEPKKIEISILNAAPSEQPIPTDTQIKINYQENLFHPQEQPEPKVAEPSKQELAAAVPEIVSNLNTKYVFENFVIGNSNRFAHAASLAVAEEPAKVYNPLFLYGDVGLGKTHLMHAIGNRIKQNNPKMKILYISSEMFTNEMIFSIQKNAMESFRNKYRNIDCLLIDDIQFLRKKESTQEEFFHTFNALRDANKQIIISSDRKPKDIETLEERLRSRFEWGLTADIQAPDLETRMAILREKATQEKTELPNDVILYIASSIQTNIREIEGAYIRVVAYASLSNSPITLDIAQKALSELNDENKNKQISIQEIQQVVSSRYKIKMEEFLAKKRTRNVAYPRQIAMYLCRELTAYSLPRIGDLFGGRDHTTVIHACEKINKERKEDSNLDREIKTLIEQLRK